MKRLLVYGLVAIQLLFLNVQSISAHEKWFHDDEPYPLRWDLFFRPLPLIFASAILAITFLAWLIWNKRGRRGFVPGPEDFGTTDDRRSALYSIVPFIIGVHVAVPLFVFGLQSAMFSPNNELTGAWIYILGLAQTGIALSFFYGGLTRLAAIALACLWVLGIALHGLEAMLDNIMYLGFAAFFFLAGRGPIAIDRLILPRLEPSEKLMRQAITASRVGVGLSLVFVAFTEKFANIPLALSFLQKYPLNFTSAFGIPMSDEIFVLCAGAVELLVGLFITFGIFPREIILIAWIPINMTLAIFNWTELVGHLPIYGALAVLLIWKADEENMRWWLRGLREGPLSVLSSKQVETQSV